MGPFLLVLGGSARLEAFRLRDKRIAATNIQRVFRGRCGRLLAARERDRFLFSRSQSHGIEFGRQMLTEHRLHGTKLQSEVALLGKEKTEVEARLELVLQEIASFEAGVRGLEREMATLSKAETQAAGTLDEVAKVHRLVLLRLGLCLSCCSGCESCGPFFACVWMMWRGNLDFMYVLCCLLC